MNEIGLDDLICSLERIIQRFGDQIVRIAPQLTVKLASLFQQLFKKETVVRMMRHRWLHSQRWSVSTRFSSKRGRCRICTRNSNPQSYRFFRFCTIRAVRRCSTWNRQSPCCPGSRIEYLAFSPQLWQMFPLVYNIFDKYGVDYLETCSR